MQSCFMHVAAAMSMSCFVSLMNDSLQRKSDVDMILLKKKNSMITEKSVVVDFSLSTISILIFALMRIQTHCHSC